MSYWSAHDGKIRTALMQMGLHNVGKYDAILPHEYAAKSRWSNKLVAT